MRFFQDKLTRSLAFDKHVRIVILERQDVYVPDCSAVYESQLPSVLDFGGNSLSVGEKFEGMCNCEGSDEGLLRAIAVYPDKIQRDRYSSNPVDQYTVILNTSN